MAQQEHRNTPWVTILSATVTLLVFLLALSQGLGQAASMGAAAFVILFVPIGLLALALGQCSKSGNCLFHAFLI